jgi:hypothetical protein
VRSSKVRLSAAAVMVVAWAESACEYPQPFVYAYREFDRSAPNFRQEPAERTWVTVCMQPFRKPDANIAALADQRCQLHGKSAVEADRRLGECPLLLSRAVVYRCSSPAS